MSTRCLFVGVDVQGGSTQVVALDAGGHVAMRTSLPRTDEVDVIPCVAELLQALSRAHGRTPLVLCVEGERWAADVLHDAVAEKLSAPLHRVHRSDGGLPVELFTQDCWGGPYRDAWRSALLAALGAQIPGTQDTP